MIRYSPGAKYAFLGKSGSGKTVAQCILCCRLVPWQPWASDWRVWWLDTKHGTDDLALLHKWGFRLAGDPHGNSARQIIQLYGEKDEMYERAQLIFRTALELGGILVVVDEYDHVVKSRTDPGPYLMDVHKRGRGLDVGLAGGVQEPAFIPRQLFSQANYLWLGGLTHLRDVKTGRELCPRYAPGWPDRTDDTVPDPHGFWLKYLDGHGVDGRWNYWRHIAEWDRSLVVPPKPNTLVSRRGLPEPLPV